RPRDRARSRAIFIEGARGGSERRPGACFNAGGRVRSVDRRDLSRWRVGGREKIYPRAGAKKSGGGYGGGCGHQYKGKFAGITAKHFAPKPGLRARFSKRT